MRLSPVRLPSERSVVPEYRHIPPLARPRHPNTPAESRLWPWRITAGDFAQSPISMAAAHGRSIFYRSSRALGDAFIQGHDARTANAKIVLQSEPRPLHLPLVGSAAQLMDELSALGKSRGAEWVALAQ